MRIVYIVLLLFTSNYSFCQSDLRKVALSDLPEEVQQLQHVSLALRWTDSTGEHILITTNKVVKQAAKRYTSTFNTSAPYRGLDSYEIKETLPAITYHFLTKKDEALLTWKVAGSVMPCDGEDMNHEKQWTVVTDLDANNQAEVWLVYKSHCLGDDNEGRLKIVMCENEVRYTITGTIGKEGISAASLASVFAPRQAAFKKYAARLWSQFSAEQ